SPAGLPVTSMPALPAASARAESSARPALSMRVTPAMSMRRAPAHCGRAERHSARTCSPVTSPLTRSASPSRRTSPLLAGIGLDPPGAQVGRDLADRLARQRGVELLAEGLHEGHAFHHHV